MALANAVQGAHRPPQAITWLYTDGAPVDLTGATLSGRIRATATGAARPIVGDLTLTNAVAGVFRWDYAPADVAEAGIMQVQFTAAYGTDPTPGRTVLEFWEVLEAI